MAKPTDNYCKHGLFPGWCATCQGIRWDHDGYNHLDTPMRDVLCMGALQRDPAFTFQARSPVSRRRKNPKPLRESRKAGKSLSQKDQDRIHDLALFVKRYPTARSIVNELYFTLEPWLLRWIKSFLERTERYEEATQIRSWTWDCLEFCLKYYKPHHRPFLVKSLRQNVTNFLRNTYRKRYVRETRHETLDPTHGEPVADSDEGELSQAELRRDYIAACASAPVYMPSHEVDISKLFQDSRHLLICKNLNLTIEATVELLLKKGYVSSWSRVQQLKTEVEDKLQAALYESLKPSIEFNRDAFEHSTGTRKVRGQRYRDDHVVMPCQYDRWHQYPGHLVTAAQMIPVCFGSRVYFLFTIATVLNIHDPTSYFTKKTWVGDWFFWW